MNAKILVFAVCVEAIIYLLLYNLQDCTFKKYLKSTFCVHLFELQDKHILQIC